MITAKELHAISSDRYVQKQKEYSDEELQMLEVEFRKNAEIGLFVYSAESLNPLTITRLRQLDYKVTDRHVAANDRSQICLDDVSK